MPRRPRIIVPNTPQHVIQRGNNRQACFKNRGRTTLVTHIWLFPIMAFMLNLN